MNSDIKEVYAQEATLQKVCHLSTSPDAAQHKSDRAQYLVRNQKSRSYCYAAVNITNILRTVK
jgi:hypothetical protein